MAAQPRHSIAALSTRTVQRGARSAAHCIGASATCLRIDCKPSWLATACTQSCYVGTLANCHLMSQRSSRARSPSAKSAPPTTAVKDLQELPSLAEIRRILPDDCFKSSASTSVAYAVRDLVISSLLLYAARCYLLPMAMSSSPTWSWTALAMLACYVLVQGTIFWALFVIGHDCGHGSFSRSRALNVAVGSLTHSVILTPFVAWRTSHRSHHKNTGNIDRDEIFQPMRLRKARVWTWRYSQNFVFMYFGLGMSWFLYLMFGFAPKNNMGYHYWPLSAPWLPRMNLGKLAPPLEIACSHAALLAVLLGLWSWVQHDGLAAVAVLYFAPLFVFGSWLVVVTFLHHNDRLSIPWFADAQWTYVKGQLSTVDRSYGWLLDHITHDIGTHQIHHLFPKIPHYKLKIATKAFRAHYGNLARSSNEPVATAFVQNARNYSDRGVIGDDVETFVM